MPNFSVDHVSAANEKPGCKRRIRLSASTIRSAVATAATNANKILAVTLSSNIAQSAKIVYPPVALTYCAACKTASTEIRKLERLQRIVWNWPMAADSQHCGKPAIIWDTPTIAPTPSGRIAYGPAKKPSGPCHVGCSRLCKKDLLVMRISVFDPKRNLRRLHCQDC